MVKSQCLSFLAILFSIAACAPISHKATYRTSSGHTSAYMSSQNHTRPIQVTLYSDSTYLGVNFQPIQIVISDGEYVEIPVKNRRGRSSRIFAHYHHGNLHFDATRKCQKIHGSTAYKYDIRWDKGYKYAHVNAGHDFDFTGLSLVIRNVPEANGRPRQVLTKKSPNARKKTTIINKYQVVKHNNKDAHNKKAVVHKQLKKVKKNVGVGAKTPKPTKQSRSEKHLNARDKIRVTSTGNPKKPVVPDVVREVSRYNKPDKKAVTVRRNGRELTDKPASERSVAAQGLHSAGGTKHLQSKPQSQSKNLSPNVMQATQDKSMKDRGSASKNGIQGQSIQKKANHAKGQKQLIDKVRNQQEAQEAIVIAQPKERDKHAKVKKDR